jgi:hypothetical protein
MPGPTTAKTIQGTSRWRFFKRFFRALTGDERYQAAVTLVLGPYLFTCLISWWDHGAFWGPKPSFFENLLVCMLFVLGGRFWDLQHKAEKAREQTQEIAEMLAGFQQALDLKMGEVQGALDPKGALGDRLFHIKGVSLDITEQLSAIERKIDVIERRTGGPPELPLATTPSRSEAGP